jgi:hypothetical protein
MGFRSYFAPKKGSKDAAPPETPEVMSPSSGSIFSEDTTTPNRFHDEKCEYMVEYLHQQQQQLRWTSGSSDEGVVMKKAKGIYATCPKSLDDIDDGFRSNIEALNVRVGSRTHSPILPYTDHRRLQ